jgi:hypothetical protein
VSSYQCCAGVERLIFLGIVLQIFASSYQFSTFLIVVTMKIVLVMFVLDATSLKIVIRTLASLSTPARIFDYFSLMFDGD